MRLLVLLALVLGIGLVVLSLAIRWQAPELAATDILSQPLADPADYNDGPDDVQAVDLVLNVKEENTPEPPTTAANVTLQACLALEGRLVNELDKAEQALNRARKEYDSAQETYEDSIGTADPANRDRLRAERDEAEDSLDYAKTAQERATKKLAKTRVECGLYK